MKKMKTTTIKIIPTLISVLLLSNFLYSQQEDAFKIIHSNIMGEAFYQYNASSWGFEGLTHFPANQYKIIDKFGNEQVYTEFSTGLAANWSGWEEQFLKIPVLGNTNMVLQAVTPYGMFTIKSPAINPKFEKYVNFANDWGIVGAPHQVMGITPVFWDNDDGQAYCLLTGIGIKIISTDGSTIYGEYPHPEDAYTITYSGLKYVNQDLWYIPYHSHGIVRFDLITKEFEVFDNEHPAMPIAIYNHLTETGDWRLPVAVKKHRYSVVVSYIDGGVVRYPVYCLHKTNTSNNKISNCLLRYKDGVWDTINLDFSNTPHLQDSNYRIHGMYYVGGTKVALTLNSLNSDINRTVIIFDLETREYESIVIPESLYAGNTLIHHFRSHFYHQGVYGYGILVSSVTRYLIFYDPTTSIIESNWLPNLWIESLYPNPAKYGRVTANIMCYVSDISTVELGLYDFMGKKVLDLSNQFEYEQATATISTTFEIPKSLAKGSYFLVVRSGKETRTRGIIVK